MANDCAAFFRSRSLFLFRRSSTARTGGVPLDVAAVDVDMLADPCRISFPYWAWVQRVGLTLGLGAGEEQHVRNQYESYESRKRCKL